MAVIFKYFDDWKGADLVRPKCGWTGRIDPARTNQYRDLCDVPCPACDTMLAIIESYYRRVDTR